MSHFNSLVTNISAMPPVAANLAVPPHFARMKFQQ
jgi:hypothetical protein